MRHYWYIEALVLPVAVQRVAIAFNCKRGRVVGVVDLGHIAGQGDVGRQGNGEITWSGRAVEGRDGVVECRLIATGVEPPQEARPE